MNLKELVLSETKRVMDFAAGLDERFTETLVNIDLTNTLFHEVHMRDENFVEIFEDWTAKGYNGNNVHLEKKEGGYTFFCLYNTQAFIERFGTDRLPKE